MVNTNNINEEYSELNNLLNEFVIEEGFWDTLFGRKREPKDDENYSNNDEDKTPEEMYADNYYDDEDETPEDEDDEDSEDENEEDKIVSSIDYKGVSTREGQSKRNWQVHKMFKVLQQVNENNEITELLGKINPDYVTSFNKLVTLTNNALEVYVTHGGVDSETITELETITRDCITQFTDLHQKLNGGVQPMPPSVGLKESLISYDLDVLLENFLK